MAFDPVDYYQLAGWLYSQKVAHSEAQARAVISKAYYAAFLVARNRAGINDKSRNVHERTHDYYSNAGKAALANRLDELRLKRNDADYDTALTLTSRDSGKVLALTKKILQELGAITS